MEQLSLPMDVEIMIPEHHLVRVVHRAVEELDMQILLPLYKGGGRSSFHPKMMLKVIVYAYTQKIYSSRSIAKALQENIYFMWLSGHQKPDFRTINRFRSDKMKDIIYEVFFSIVDLLKNKGLVRLEHYFLDGTKIEASANKYTFVWKKSTEKYDLKLDEKYRTIVAGIEQIANDDIHNEEIKDIDQAIEEDPITSEQIENTVKLLETRLELEPKNKTLKKLTKQLKSDLLPRKRKYEEQKASLQGRNSFSKTDKDATFMRMKEDHMLNGN